MPIVSRKQYAELCGDDVLKINMWIKRGKISVSAVNKKLINTENAVNAAFMSDRRRFNALDSFNGQVPENSTLPEKVSKNEPKKAKTVTKVAKTVTKIPKKVTKTPAKRPEKVIVKANSAQKSQAKAPVKPAEPKEIRVFDKRIAEQSARDERRVDQDMQKKALEIENLELAKQVKILQLNKSAGKLLDIDLVRGVLTRHANSIFKSFEKGCENIAGIFAGSDQHLFAGIMRDLKPELSRCVKDAGIKADEEIDILIAEFSEKLARGQRKV